MVGWMVPRLLGQKGNIFHTQGHYVTCEQSIHAQANMLIHCLTNNYIKIYMILWIFYYFFVAVTKCNL